MPSIRGALTSACWIVFAFFALSASGMAGDLDVPLLVLVGFVALAVLWTVAAKGWHVANVTYSTVRSPRPTRGSDSDGQRQGVTVRRAAGATACRPPNV